MLLIAASTPLTLQTGREMAELPEDVTTDILTRLPVNSLLRFRCVSKHFRALIDDQDFIKGHLNRSLQTKSNHKLILRDWEFGTSASTTFLFSVSFDELDRTLRLDHPFGANILGSVNGILCLQNRVFCLQNRNGVPCLQNRGNKTVIRNFATRTYQKIPEIDIDFSGQQSASNSFLTIAYGFGYDSVSDDYKLLRLVQLNAHYSLSFDSSNSEAKVYSLRSNSWQKIQGSPYYIHFGKSIGVLVCGALHWVMVHKHANLIVAFDLATNEYKQVDHPEFLNKVPSSVTKLNGPSDVTELEGRLCVPCVSSERVDLWVMKNYGVKESWSKLFTVSQPGVISSFKFVYPLTYSKSGTEIMLNQDNQRLLWYSLKEGTVRSIYICGCPDDFLPQVCVESLVPLSEKIEDYTKKKGEKGPKEKQIKGAKKRCSSGSSRKAY